LASHSRAGTYTSHGERHELFLPSLRGLQVRVLVCRCAAALMQPCLRLTMPWPLSWVWASDGRTQNALPPCSSTCCKVRAALRTTCQFRVIETQTQALCCAMHASTRWRAAARRGRAGSIRRQRSRRGAMGEFTWRGSNAASTAAWQGRRDSLQSRKCRGGVQRPWQAGPGCAAPCSSGSATAPAG